MMHVSNSTLYLFICVAIMYVPCASNAVTIKATKTLEYIHEWSSLVVTPYLLKGERFKWHYSLLWVIPSSPNKELAGEDKCTLLMGPYTMV